MLSYGGKLVLINSVLRPYLDPLNFYKIWFLAIVYKNWVLKNWSGVFEDQFLKTVNIFLLSSF
jgi:hypothetical protein